MVSSMSTTTPISRPSGISPTHGTDLTGSADPMDPAYAIPNGLVDLDDLFFFLDRFNEGC